MRFQPPTATPLDYSVLRSAWTADFGAVNRFRAALSAYLGVNACFLAASGRAALFLLLTTLRSQARHPARTEVALPAYTCPSLVKVIQAAGLTPRLVDVSPYTLSYNSAELATAVGERTLALVCVHPFGIPHPLDAVQKIAADAGAVLIEDAAQALGAKTGGRHVGTMGDFGLFSLGPGKPLATAGGGFVGVSGEAATELLRRAWEDLPRATGAASNLAALRLALFSAAFHPTGWWLASRAGAQRIGDNEASWNFALRGLTPAQAAAGMALLPRLDAINAARRRRGEQLMAALDGLPGLSLPARLAEARSGQTGRPSDSEPIYLRLPLILESEAQRDAVHRVLWNAGYGAGKMYRRTLAEIFPVYADGAYPGAEQVARRLLTLPTHHYLAEHDITRMAGLVQHALRSEHGGTHSAPSAEGAT